jgi:hypothetical protein
MSACPAVILVHGLWLWRNPWLQWAAGCAGAIRAAGGQPVWFGYSRRVAWTAFLRPTGGTAAHLVRRFLALYDRVHARHGPPSVIANSFGTYLVTRALSDFEGARLHALILFGSIVSETFDWATVVARGQVTWARMRNEVGAHAAAVRFAAALRRFGYPYGGSGVTGFQLNERSPSMNARYAGPWLADAALARYCHGVWMPLLGLTERPRRSLRTPAVTAPVRYLCSAHRAARCKLDAVGPPEVPT